MRHRIFKSISRFFEGAGSVLNTPSSEPSDHVSVPIDTMHDLSRAKRIYGH